MTSHFTVAALAAGFFLAAPAVAAPAVNVVTPADIKATTALISYVYEGYANGANDRKSFFQSVPWDIDTGNLIAKIEKCEAAEGELSYLDFDWPSASQDPQIANLKVTYVGSPKPGIATVRAAFGDAKWSATIDYDLTLYDSAPLPRRWGVSTMRVHAKGQEKTPDLLTVLKSELTGECKAYDRD